jgi:ribosomal protein L28
MTQRYHKFKRACGMWYAFDTATGNSVSLKTRVKTEAEQKVNAMNETERQPSISHWLAKVYLNATDPKLATRTWQEVMENIVAKKMDETRRRWDVAIRDRNFDCIRNLRVAETRPEHFDRALADGKMSANVYLRRIHNHAPAMAQAGVQGQAGNHGGVTRGHRPAGTERGAAGFLRIAVAHRRVANGRGLSAGGGCGLEQPHD